MIEHSGNLLIKVPETPYEKLASGPHRLDITGFEVEPLFKAYQQTEAFSAERPEDQWFLANPHMYHAGHPWDIAHRVAAAAKYSFYAEPDVLHTDKARSPTPQTGGLNPNWPPYGSVSPGWHLMPGYAGFKSPQAKVYDGKGVRIAHLDTGYSPIHDSKPLYLCPQLGWNFYENNADTVDHGTAGNPGHGPATLALLAGNKLDMVFGGHRFHDYFGGAPMSEIIPVRIGASVIHVFTSAMARGIDYALAPSNDRKNRCDVVTISHGGLPSPAWAAAVNNVYEDGIVVAAASGDHIIFGVIDLPGHETIWPSRFRRVITVLGATYEKRPYVTDTPFVLQGSYGPQSIMDKAIAAYTPNVPWIRYDTKSGYDMNGGGTSASTPQVAAACALWLQKHNGDHPQDWKRVAACRYALFHGAYRGVKNSADGTRKGKRGGPDRYLGTGILDVPGMLSVAVPKRLSKEPPAELDTLFWEKRMQMGAPKSNEEMMFAVEVAQLVHRSTIAELVREAVLGPGTPGPNRPAQLQELVRQDPDASAALKARVSKAK